MYVGMDSLGTPGLRPSWNIRLLPADVMLFAPLERDLPQRFGAEFKPSRLNLVPPKGVLEMPECTCAVNGVQQILANPVGLHRMREVLHDQPLVNIELRGKLLEAITRNNSLGDLPFLSLPIRKVR